MKLYLSSYQLGNETQTLRAWVPNQSIGYIPNALDFSDADPDRREAHIERDTISLQELDLEVDLIDLRDYFHKHSELEQRLAAFGAIFISGGNVFVLRQAMKLSGLDEFLRQNRGRSDFLYAGYSAAGCVLGPNLKPYQIVDGVDTPYALQKEVIWDGLNFIDFAFMPHWDSDHPESKDIDSEIAFCKEHGIPFKAIRDGDVLLFEQA